MIFTYTLSTTASNNFTTLQTVMARGWYSKYLNSFKYIAFSLDILIFVGVLFASCSMVASEHNDRTEKGKKNEYVVIN